MIHNTVTASNAKEIVLSCVKAINERDLKIARTYVSDDLQFRGAMGTGNGAQAYFEDMEKMKLKYDIKEAFADGDDVCLLYDLRMSGQTICGCSWYHIEDEKITSLVVFDPCPLPEKH